MLKSCTRFEKSYIFRNIRFEKVIIDKLKVVETFESNESTLDFTFDQRSFFSNLRHFLFHIITDTVQYKNQDQHKITAFGPPYAITSMCAGAKLTVSHCSVVSRLNIKAVSVEAPAAISLGANPISVVHKVEIQKVCIPGSAKSLPLIKTALFKRLTWILRAN